MPGSKRPRYILAAVLTLLSFSMASWSLAQEESAPAPGNTSEAAIPRDESQPADAEPSSTSAPTGGSEPINGGIRDEEMNEIMTDAPHSGVDKSGGTAPEADPVLEKALGHLSRAIVLKRAGDVESSIAEFLKAVEVSPKVTSYNDEGIILEIIRRYLSQAKARGSSSSYDDNQASDDEESPRGNQTTDKRKIQMLNAEITDLNGKIADLEKEVSSTREEYEEKEKELAAEVEKLKEELADADHMRAVYKGRWLRLKDD